MKRLKSKELSVQIMEPPQDDDGKTQTLVDYLSLNKELASSAEFHHVAVGLDQIDDLDTLSEDKLKQICRAGLSHSLRRDVWLKVTGARDIMNSKKNLYDSEYKAVFKNFTVEDLPVIPFFGHSADLSYHHLTAEGLRHLRIIMVMLYEMHVGLDYCPVLVDIAAVCLGYMSPIETFYLTHALIQRSKQDSWYLPLSARQVAACSETARQLLEDRSPAIHKHINTIGALPGTLQIFGNWISAGFVTHVPRYTFLRILDAFFFEGVKIFFRIVLGIMKIHNQELIEAHESSKFLDHLLKLNDGLHDGSQLMKVSFAFSLSRKKIEKCQQQSFETLTQDRIPVIQKFTKIDYPVFNPSDSDVFTRKAIFSVYRWLPPILHTRTPKRIFCTIDDGYSLSHMYKKIKDRGPLLFGIRAAKGRDANSVSSDPKSDGDVEIFGFFISKDIVLHGKAITDRLMFLFRKDTDDHYCQYKWSEEAKDNDVAYVASDTFLAISGGGTAAIYLRGLQEGTTSQTLAFANPALVKAKSGEFFVGALEVWSFSDL